jgi:hypothetical protein
MLLLQVALIGHKRLRASTDALAQTLGCAVLAHAYAISNPPRSREMRDMAIEAFAGTQQHELNTDLAYADLMFVVGSCYVWEDNTAGALAAFDQVPDNSSRHDHVTLSQLAAQTEAATCLLLLGEPKKALDRVASLEGIPYAYNGCGTQMTVALARLGLSDVEAARRLIRDYAVEAATGKLSNQCSEGLLLLAELAHFEGDNATAIGLLAEFGIGRMPSTTQRARVLARQLGIAEQIARNEQAVFAPAHVAEHGVLGIRRMMVALHGELTRRGWD